MARIRKRKITSKLIENFSQRKICYKTRLKGLFTKMNQVTTLCDLEACAIVFGPGDRTPVMWPSRDVAERLIHKLESMSECLRFKNVTDQLSFLKDKGERLQATVDKMKEDNEDRLMGSYMYQIENEGKPLSDFEPSVLNRLIRFMLKKYKIFSQKEEYYFPPPPPLPSMSCPLDDNNGADYEINTNEQSLNQQPLLDLVYQSDRMVTDFDNNVGSSIGPLPHENFEGFNNSGNGIPQGNSEGFPNNKLGIAIQANPSVGGGDTMFPRENFGVFLNSIDRSMGIPPYANPRVRVDEFFPQGKFDGFNGGSTSRVFNEGNNGGFNGENYSGNGENHQSNLFPQGDLKGFNGIPTNDGSGTTMSIPSNINEDNNNGRPMESFNGNFGDNNY
ncbi:unnamed protein product [Vicia faba]|uniref:MADS-box domain-containing protein n=1 Tax=Vicia faba TaxID=3906 RepID=A0AAV1AY70_VICFA|nr:unnamed protein product [Vicia faba]